MSARIVASILSRPRTHLVAGLVLALVFVSGARHAETDFGYRAWFHEGDPLLERYDAFEARFGNDEAVVVLVHSPSGVFDDETARLVVELTELLEAIDDIARVDSLATMDVIRADGDDLIITAYLSSGEWSDSELNELRRGAVEDELAPGYLVSADGRTTLLFAWLRSAPGADLDPTAALDAARRLVDERRETSDHRFFLNGGPALIESFRLAAEHDAKTLLPAALGLMTAVLALAFRSARGVALSLVVVISAIAMTVGAAGLLGLPFNNVTAVVPQFLIAIAVATTMHVLLTYFRASSAGASQRAAAKAALESNFEPTLLTSTSTALGFFSFTTAAVQPIAHLGILSGIGTLLAWVATYNLVGPLLVLIPSRASASRRSALALPALSRLVGAIARFRRTIIVGFALGCIVAAVIGAGNKVDSDPLAYFAEDVPIRRATSFAEAELGGVYGLELVVESDGFDGVDDVDLLRAVDDLQSWIDTRPFVTKTVSALSFIKPLHRAVYGGEPGAYRVPEDGALTSQLMLLLPSRVETAYVDAESASLRISVLWTLHEANASIDAAKSIEDKARTLGLKASATGKNLLYSQLNAHVVQTFVTSLLLAIASVSLLLVFAFRSLALGALALIPNVVPLLLGAGLLKLLGKPLDIGTVIVSSVCLGIAVDDTIHFLSAYHRELAQRREPVEAVIAVLRSVGPALVGTTLALVAGFGLLAIASFAPNRDFGLLVSFGLVVALLADLVLLPALLLSRFRNLMPAFKRTVAMKKSVPTLAGLIFGASLVPAHGRSAELDGRTIAERTLARDDGTVMFRVVTLVSCDYEVTTDGSQRCAATPRTKRFHSLMENVGPHRHDVMLLNVIEAPAAEKGVGFLQRNHAEQEKDSEQWMYLPALRRVKRITTEASGGPKRGHLFGSELAYEDMEQWHLDDYAYALAGEVEISGRAAWVLELIPTPEREAKSSYKKLKMWIDRDSLLPVKVEAFKGGARPAKTIHGRSLENVGGVWLVRETVVVNHESERMSLLKVTAVAVNSELPDGWSHQRALEDASYREPVIEALARQAR